MQRKLTKRQARYEHPAKGKQHCGICIHYQAAKVAGKGGCEIVQGVILAKDWCKEFRGSRDPQERQSPTYS